MIKRSPLAIALAFTFFAPLAHAVDDDIEAVGDSYIRVGDSVLTTGLDECTRSGSFSDDAAIDACEGIESAPEAVAEAPVEPAPTAAPTKAVVSTREVSELAFFDNNSSDLNANGMASIELLYGKLATFKGITSISVTGHTSARGAEDYNQALSERRAQTVANVLSARYPDATMTVTGMGETQPISERESANRRVEVEVEASNMTFE